MRSSFSICLIVTGGLILLLLTNTVYAAEPQGGDGTAQEKTGTDRKQGSAEASRTTSTIGGVARPNAETSQRATQVWLTDLDETHVEVGAGKLGKHGLAGCVPGPIKISGVASPHALGMRPDGQVEYSLGKKYRSFRASAALSDVSGKGTIRPVQFRVLGDGRLLWKSIPIRRLRGGEPCLLDISGVSVLRLEVQFIPNAEGDASLANAAWVEPYVSDSAPVPEAMSWFKPERFEKHEALFEELEKSRALFDGEKFAELEKIADKWRKSETLYGGFPILFSFYQRLTDPLGSTERDWQKHISRLERWIKIRPESVTPLVVLGDSYINYAWQARGNGLASQVSPDAWPKFEERLAKAREYLEKAKTIGGDPHVYAALLSVALGQSSNKDDVMELVESGRKQFPRYYPIYESAAFSFLPQWGGDLAAFQKFAAQIREELGGELGDEVYFRVATQLIGTIPENSLPLKKAGFGLAELRRGMKVVLRDYPDERLYFNSACFIAALWQHEDETFARLLFTGLDPTTFTKTPWRSYARMEDHRRGVNHDTDYDRDVKDVEYPSSAWIGNVAFFGSSDRIIGSGSLPRLSIRYLVPHMGKLNLSVPVEPNVGGLAVDADGKTILVRWLPQPQNPIKEAQVFRIGPGEEPLTLKGHTADLVGVAVSRDGSQCGTTALDKTARLWTLSDVEHPIVLTHPRDPLAIAFSPDGKAAATADARGVIWLWDAATGKAIGEPLGIEEPDHGQCRLRFLPDGRELIWVAKDGKIRRWNIQTRRFQETVGSRGDLISQADVSRDGQWLAIGHEGGAVCLIATNGWKTIRTWEDHYDAVSGLSFSPDGAQLLSSSLDGTVKLRQIKDLIARNSNSP